MNFDVIIVGGGILGFSTAMQLLQADPKLRVAVIEKEKTPAKHQTGHNSGVIHAGVYYAPGSLKAQFCVSGCQQTKEFCRENGIAFSVPGKLIVATEDHELKKLAALAARCQQNGLTVESLSAKETRARQPGINTVGAFLVKETGIVNWQAVCSKYAEIFMALGGKIFYGETVTEIMESNGEIQIKTHTSNRLNTAYLITCAGLQSDRLVKMSGIKPDFKIIPFRGEYYRLTPRFNSFFNYLIYPVPDPKLPFLGVHFTPQISGYTTVGPNAVLALAREGYGWTKVNFKDTLEMLSHLPLWKMLSKHVKTTFSEFRDSLFPKYYLQTMQRYFPEITKNDLMPYPAGVRAQAISASGELCKDFIFSESQRILHVCNAPSPAATSSLPIGKYLVDKFFKKIR